MIYQLEEKMFASYWYGLELADMDLKYSQWKDLRDYWFKYGVYGGF